MLTNARRVLALLGLALATTAPVAGCADDAPATDAGSLDGAVDGGLPTTVDIPWLADGVPPIAPPVLTPCPAGWREVLPATPDGVATCDPYPAAGAQDCPAGRAHFPGEAECADVGNACPPGDWPDGLPAVGVVYVQASAPTGGDGTFAAPYARIADALRAASAGTIVAVAKGRYVEAVALPPGVTIAGACAAETLLAPSSLGTSTAAVSATRVGTARARDVGVVSSPGYGVRVAGSGVELELHGVEIVSATSSAILVEARGHLVARGLVVRDTRPRAADAMFGRGISLQDGRAEVARAVFARNCEIAVYAGGADSTLALEDVAIRDTQSQQSDRTGGWGMSVEAGASATLARVLFVGNRDLALFATDAGTTLGLTDTVVRDTRPQESDGRGGTGLNVKLGASGALSRVLVEQSRTTGIFASEAGTMLTLEDVVVRDTLGEGTDGVRGRGLEVISGAAASLSRTVVEHSRELGVFASGSGTVVDLTDVVVRDTQGQPGDGTGGGGLDVQEGAGARASRVLVERNRAIGVYAGGAETSLELTDVVVRDTDSRASDGAGGRGLNVESAATAHVARALFERNREVGVYAGVPGTVVALSDVVVRQTSLPRCESTSCTGMRPAVGIGSYAAALDVRSFVIDGSELCGVQIAFGGGLDLHRGLVARSEIGACVQVDGYDLTRLQDDVTFLDVGTALATTTLPVPDPATPLGAP